MSDNKSLRNMTAPDSSRVAALMLTTYIEDGGFR